MSYVARGDLEQLNSNLSFSSVVLRIDILSDTHGALLFRKNSLSLLDIKM